MARTSVAHAPEQRHSSDGERVVAAVADGGGLPEGVALGGLFDPEETAAEEAAARVVAAGCAPEQGAVTQALRRAGAAVSPRARVHEGGRAAGAAAALSAEAFTVGDDVYLGAVSDDPAERARVLAHELAHTGQDGGAAPVRRSVKELTAQFEANDARAAEAAPPERTADDPAAAAEQRAAYEGLKTSPAPTFAQIAGTSPTLIKALPVVGDSVPRRVLQQTCDSSWHRAKSTLAAGQRPDVQPTPPAQTTSLQAMMQRLWDYRQWHHEDLLKRTQAKVNAQTKNAKGLATWSAAGSASLTSDIDVNLKGEETERAVAVFNAEFAQEGWKHEAGVVYDVNVYALDFMHGMGTKGAVGSAQEGLLLPSEEGKREGRVQGGTDAEADAESQEQWALVKLLIYMSPQEWADYKKATDPEGTLGATHAAAEARYAAYREELAAAMGTKAAAVVAEAEQAEEAGARTLDDHAQEGDHAAAENAVMAASNRLYEKKLVDIKTRRVALAKVVAQHDAAAKAGAHPSVLEKYGTTIDDQLVELRTRISECALYSNEAYITSGAVVHGVVGLQVGKQLSLTASDTMNAVHENYADALKEIGRHGDTLGEAAYKSGKYLWRMADAAKNLGHGALPGVEAVYQLGYECANVIKKLDTGQEAASAAEATARLGVGTVAELKAKVMEVGNAVTVAQRTAREKAGGAARATPVRKERHA